MEMNQHHKSDDYVVEEMENKKDSEEEPTEDAPLKGDYVTGSGGTDLKENDTNLPPATVTVKDCRAKGFRGWLAKPRVMWCIAVIVAIFLLSVVLVATLLAVEYEEDVYEDPVPRFLYMWPRPNRRNNILAFRHGSLPYEGKHWPKLTSQLDRLWNNYESVDRSNVTECYNIPTSEDTVCYFDIRTIAIECNKLTHYGYEEGKPCILFQFSNITDWKPESYSTRDLESSELELPNDLRYQYKPYVVFLDCQGDSIVDQENMGPVQYSPERGFHTKYFPYKDQPNYMPPLVAVRFQDPAVGVAISVTCKLWAKNINHTEEALPKGSISFSLLVD
ncbi:sodium/potassium-transporting ATPase subunit beta-like [Centruroides vittatus]|uniref:sodium/potassium-transporting ATPase subunit beta-like n=1 Tax=Centruroides vittatus TaxID=120091 RepID=UPI0035104BBD